MLRMSNNIIKFILLISIFLNLIFVYLFFKYIPEKKFFEKKITFKFTPAPAKLELLKKLKIEEFPDFNIRYQDIQLLKVGLQENLHYFQNTYKKNFFIFGNDTFTVSKIINTNKLLLSYLEKNDAGNINEFIKNNFDIFESIGIDSNYNTLFTGYYIPKLNGSYKKTEKYKYPLYSIPNDRIIIDLSAFAKKYEGQKIIARYDRQTHSVTPYYDREEIDFKNALKNKKLELLWVSDLVEAFFLQIQGSGIIEFPDKNKIFVVYDGQNGREYTSIGTLLINENKLSKDKVSLFSIKKYLKEHPEDLKHILTYNKSYIFFKFSDSGAVGATGEKVIRETSCAVDSKIFPFGAVAYIKTTAPVSFDEKNDTVILDSFNRILLTHDTGGAIKGPGRVDIFFGEGVEAELKAGFMKNYGKLYFLMIKENSK